MDHRDRTGEGQHLDLSQLEASLYFVGTAMMDYTANGRVTTRDGNRHPSMAPHGAYRCAGEDTWCAIACADDAHWRALCDAMGRAELAADARFATAPARKAREAGVDEVVEAWTRLLAPDDVMGRCAAAGVPAGVVRTPEGLFADPQLTSRGHFVFMDHAEMGRYASDGNCFVMSDAAPDATT